MQQHWRKQCNSIAVVMPAKFQSNWKLVNIIWHFDLLRSDDKISFLLLMERELYPNHKCHIMKFSTLSKWQLPVQPVIKILSQWWQFWFIVSCICRGWVWASCINTVSHFVTRQNNFASRTAKTNKLLWGILVITGWTWHQFWGVVYWIHPVYLFVSPSVHLTFPTFFLGCSVFIGFQQYLFDA